MVNTFVGSSSSSEHKVHMGITVGERNSPEQRERVMCTRVLLISHLFPPPAGDNGGGGGSKSPAMEPPTTTAERDRSPAAIERVETVASSTSLEAIKRKLSTAGLTDTEVSGVGTSIIASADSWLINA